MESPLIKHSDSDAARYVNMEDQQRRQVFIFSTILLCLALIGFGTFWLLQGNYLIGVTDFLFAVLALSMILSLRKMKKGLLIYRLGTGFLIFALMFWLKTGAAEGAGVLWIFMFPLFSFFILGKREGLYWSLGLLCCCVWLFMNPMTLFEVFSYSMAMKIRCIFLLLVIIAFTYNYEAVKEKFQNAMKTEHANLLMEREKLAEANRLLNTEMNERKHAENELKQAHDKLEQRVEERTRELTRLNIELSGEIEERKKAEAQLVPLSTAIENAAEAIVITDAEGWIRYVNPAFEGLTGYARAEVLGRNPGFMKSDSNDTPFYENLWRTIQSGQVWMGHFFNKKKDGDRIHLDATISPIKDVTNRIVGFVAVSRDVTEKIRMENKLRQAQKMEAIGTLAGGIAHDFNNILSAIMGYTELSMLKASHDSRLLLNLQKIQHAGNRARDLIQQILTFSRQKGEERKPVKVAAVVTETLKLMRASLPATIRIDQNLASESTVMADPTHIHQIIMNLCTNAAHAMRPNGGILTIDLTDTVLDMVFAVRHPNILPGFYIRLSVSDTGHGISSGDIERIFDPFFTTKAIGEGTGMGLSVVHGIVKGYNGTISVYSELNVGTAFYVYLPISQDNEVVSAELVKALPVGTETILYVDDEENLVDIGKEMLEHLGYRVFIRTSSLDALACFKQNPEKFDLVITDLTMPNMTGNKLAQRILEIRPDIPILICSGYNDQLVERSLSPPGIKGCLLKPVIMKDIAFAVRRALDSARDSDFD